MQPPQVGKPPRVGNTPPPRIALALRKSLQGSALARSILRSAAAWPPWGWGQGTPPPQTPQLHGTGVHPSLVPAGEGSSGGIFTAKSHKKPTVGTMLTAMPCSPAHHGGITPQPLCWGQIKALGGGGGRDKRAADLALLVLNYSLEKAEIKRQEAPAGAPWAWACLVRRCFPFFYSLFPLCLFDGAQQTIPPPPPPRTPTQRGGPRMGGCPPPLCWVGC